MYHIRNELHQTKLNRAFTIQNKSLQKCGTKTETRQVVILSVLDSISPKSYQVVPAMSH